MVHAVEEKIRLSEPRDKEPEESTLFQPMRRVECTVCGSWQETKREKEAILRINDEGREMDFVRNMVRETTHERRSQADNQPGNLCPTTREEAKGEQGGTQDRKGKGRWGCCIENANYERVVEAVEGNGQEKKDRSQKEERQRRQRAIDMIDK